MSEARERPIIFCDEMVRAIEDGSKTQTRRLIGPANQYEVGPLGDVYGLRRGPVRPYANRDDVLWVRECFSLSQRTSFQDHIELQEWDGPLPKAPPPGWMLHYRSRLPSAEPGVWRPSIHMPRWAARLFLRVTGVRAEPLHDIGNEDSVAEGCEGVRTYLGHGDFEEETPRDVFRQLWDEINGGRAPWASNPWVWVVEFEKLEGYGHD